MGFFSSVFADSNTRSVAKMQKLVTRINALEPAMQALSEAELRAKTAEFRRRLQNGEKENDILPEAFAVAREGAVRVLGQRPFDVQLIGGITLHQGRIAEMKTGEGKTLSATLPAYLNALSGRGVHVVTVNEYLAGFHSEWMGKLYNYLGLTVGFIYNQMSQEDRVAAYQADVTYGTNSEFGFDYLRDNMVIYKAERCQRELHYAIVDEVDSILIDEARTPLIISGPGEKSTELYSIVDRAVGRLKPETEYTVDEKERTAQLTDEGVAKMESNFGVENLGDVANTELNHHIHQALKANFLFKRDRDYVVSEGGEVLIVDEFTGRILVGRRYSEGLHQAIEAKERVEVARENQTLATITYQNYFRMYKKLAGMTGTAKTEEEEFQSIYNLDVVCIPTNRPMIRQDHNDAIYRTVKGKFNAVVEEVAECHQQGQPVLVGTVSVENSEILSTLLRRKGIRHEVLNAKNHAKEAEIIAQAGRLNAVTIATNMAGRGTDILLGGNPDFLARRELRKRNVEEHIIELATGHQDTEDEQVLAVRAQYKELYANFKQETDAEHEQVTAVGGLHIVGTERHESRRIDNQLRGRAGRQGDPGSSRFYISLEDDLMRLFGGDRMLAVVDRLGLQEDQVIQAGILSKQIENAQKRVEGRNFEVRKHVLEYDDVMNTQRSLIYSQRGMVLEGQNVKTHILDMVKTLVQNVAEHHTQSPSSEEWTIPELKKELAALCLDRPTANALKLEKCNQHEIIEICQDAALQYYEQREKQFAEMGIDMREVERIVLLRSIDNHWKEHIDAMDQLRQGITLRSFAQTNPVNEYKKEGFAMFDELISAIREETVRGISFINLVDKRPLERKRVAQPMFFGAPGEQAVKKKPAKTARKVGRNDPCPCGSGKKYKNCCDTEG